MPCLSNSSLQTTRPSPVPCSPAVPLSERRRSIWNRLRIWSSVMPVPVSEIATCRGEFDGVGQQVADDGGEHIAVGGDDGAWGDVDVEGDVLFLRHCADERKVATQVRGQVECGRCIFHSSGLHLRPVEQVVEQFNLFVGRIEQIMVVAFDID